MHNNIQYTDRIGNTKTKKLFDRFKTITYLLISYLSTFSALRSLQKLLPKYQYKTFNSICYADYIISAPGGYIHDTNFAFYISLFHIYLGILLNKKVILAPQSIGPIDGKIGKIIAKHILSRSRTICVREDYSYNFLNNVLNIPKSLIVKTGDSAFWNNNILLDSHIINEKWISTGFPPVKSGKLFGITVVNWSFPKSKNPSQSRENYINAIAETIDYISLTYDMTPVIFNQVSDDYEMALSIAKRSKTHIYVDTASHDSATLRAFIAKSTIFLGSRFHSCIFAMMTNRPTIAISYLPKTEHILYDLGLSNRQINIDQINSNFIIQIFENDLSDLKNTERIIKNSILRYCETHIRFHDALTSNK
jgi:colanic acid/amylovoran biosynthesis protein